MQQQHQQQSQQLLPQPVHTNLFIPQSPYTTEQATDQQSFRRLTATTVNNAAVHHPIICTAAQPSATAPPTNVMYPHYMINQPTHIQHATSPVPTDGSIHRSSSHAMKRVS